MTKLQRPKWAEKNEAMRDYYDHSWGIPSHDSQWLFELFSLEVFQAGLSWNGVWQKRDAFRQAFANFAVDRVAAMGQDDYHRLMVDEAIIRNQRKIMATIRNAQTICQLKKKRGINFAEYCWSLVGHQQQPSPVEDNDHLPAKTDLSIRVSRQMKRDGFSGVGPVVAMSFLCAAGLIDVRHEKNQKKC